MDKKEEKEEKLSNVLIVDQDPAAMDVLKNMLVGRGFEVGTAGTGREAINFVKEGDYDVIITDYNMPDVDGYKLINTIKMFYRDYKVMIVSEDEDKQELLLKRGALDAFGKPLDMEGFIDELSKLIEERRKSKRYNRGKEIVGKDIGCIIRDRSAKTEYKALLLNISIDGALVELKEKMPKVEFASLEFYLSEKSRIMCKVNGRIVRVDPVGKKFHAAIFFNDKRSLELLEYFAPAINFLKK